MKPSELITLKATREEAVHAAARAAEAARLADLNQFIRRVQDELDLTEAAGWRYKIVADLVVLTHLDLDGQANLRPRGNHIMLDQLNVPLTNANITILLDVLTPTPPNPTPPTPPAKRGKRAPNLHL